MANRTLAATLILVFLVSVPASSAFLEVDVDDEKSAYLGDDVYFNVSVTKFGAIYINVFFEVTGGPEEWISSVPGRLFVPGQGESVVTSVGFFPTGEAPGKFQYTVSAVSYSPPASASDTLTLNVIRPLDIDDFTVSLHGNELFLNVLMSSKDKRDAELVFVILNNRGETLQSFSLTAAVEGSTIIEESIGLPENMLAGDYNVVASLVGTPVEREYMFTVLPVHNVVESVKQTSSALYDDFEITITNEGNINEPEYVSHKTLPNNDWVTGLITEPEGCSLMGGEKVCSYVFRDLAPGESAILEYRLDYTPIYAGLGVALIAVFMVVVLTMRRATGPVIIKRHVRKSGGRHHIVLEIKNPFYQNLSNTIVRDWVTPLANVLHNEINMMKPLVRRSDAGTELIWKLGDIMPKETRIITYPLKTLVRGSLKMPRAYIRYNKPNGKLRRIFSRGLIIES